MLRTIERLALRLLAVTDAAANRLYSARLNPLYQSGTIVVVLYLSLVATGLWLILFYRVGAPWESVARLTANPWIGTWVRALHRYASDAAVVATLVHAFRMFAQGRSWGARALAWVSGGLLAFLLLLCGWTGYVLVWDTFGERLAIEGARMFDALPFLSEPLARTFTGERPVPSVFFFVTLFAHIGIPLGMGVVFWLHIKRLERPVLLPPRALAWASIACLTAVSIASPLVMAPRANAFALPEVIPSDVFFAFWMPVTGRLSGGTALALLTAGVIAFLVLPAFTKRGADDKPLPSVVDEDICTGCFQCSRDCPYGAIQMIERANRRSLLVAHVDPDLCVSCGICAGSCAPMGVGPPGRTGRDQLAQIQTFLASPARRPGEIVAVCCAHGAAAYRSALAAEGAATYATDCAGNLHTSSIEMLLRGGAGGVLVLTCPPRDCWNREGPKWLTERVYHDREAELQARVDRARVRIVPVAAGECREAVLAFREFLADVSRLALPMRDRSVAIEAECERTPVGDRA
ncbi:MAG TPA: hydrogenase iron-sulfur subunit [Vicinamibacterales bacterium]|nr:hydrogenase iron-sulfur subunit [Vicinamibacterales bacterium]